MGKALFVGASVAFFSIYLAFAAALGIIGTDIKPIQEPAEVPTSGGIIGAVEGILKALEYAFDLFGQFVQLITFSAPGLEAVSLVTALIFVPLAFVNGYIIFTAIRGS